MRIANVKVAAADGSADITQEIATIEWVVSVTTVRSLTNLPR
jgi:hypothetical protein